MSRVIYGAVRLTRLDAKANRLFQENWRRLAELHELWVQFERPGDDYLQPDIIDLWSNDNWIRFSLCASAEDDSADNLLFLAAQHGEEILAGKQPSWTTRKVWPRVPQWRCLNFMLWHEDIADAYLVVEHTSGDAAAADEAKHAPLTEVLEEIWWNYCINQETEDAVIYHIDLTKLPM